MRCGLNADFAYLVSTRADVALASSLGPSALAHLLQSKNGIGGGVDGIFAPHRSPSSQGCAGFAVHGIFAPHSC